MEQGFHSIQVNGRGLDRSGYSYMAWAKEFQGQDIINAFIVSKDDWSKIEKDIDIVNNVPNDPKRILGHTPLVSWSEDLEQMIKEADGYIIGHLE